LHIVRAPAQPPRPIRALRGQILSPTPEGVLHLRDGMVRFDDAGRIVEVGPSRTLRKRHHGPVADLRPALIVPGFVDPHLHYPQTRIIGRATGPLLAWLEQTVFPEEARFARPSYARVVADEFIERMLQTGTTTAAVFSSSNPKATETLFRRLDASGMRAMVGLTLMDRRCPKALQVRADDALEACRGLVRRWHGRDDDRLRFAITPRFALSCSRKLLAGAGRLAREHHLPVQTHVAETRLEGEETLKAHRYADSYLDVYAQNGLLGKRTVLAHAIHLSNPEWKQLAASGAGIAHCPDSNFFLGSGRMKLARARARHIHVGLGSDIAAGRSFSLRRAMAHAYDNARCLGATLEPLELFRMATLEGAQVLGWDTRVGSIEAGKDADLAVFDVGADARDVDALLAELIFDNDGITASRVYVRGRRLRL
jgi:guanine deaminase